MSRYFGAAGESDSGDDDFDEDNNRDQVVETNRLGAYDSSSDDDDKREVLSEKDKRWKELKDTINRMKKNMKSENWNEVVQNFESFMKTMDKAKKVFKKEGGTPDFCVIHLAYIQKFSEDKKAEAKTSNKRLSKTNSKSLNQLVQRIKKTNRLYTKEIEKLEKDGKLDFTPEEEPDVDEDRDEDEDRDDDRAGDDDEDGAIVQKDTEWSDDDWGDEPGAAQDDEDSDSGSSVDIDVKAKGIDRSFWLKKTTINKKKEEEKQFIEDFEELNTPEEIFDYVTENYSKYSKLAKKIKTQLLKGFSPDEIAEFQKMLNAWIEKRREKVDKTGRVEKKGADLNAEALIKKIADLEEQRGKRRIDRKAYAEDLEGLIRFAKTAGTKLKIQALLATSLFDVTLSTGKALPSTLWKKAATQVSEIIDTLVSEDMLRLSEDDEVDENWDIKEIEADEESKAKEGEDEKKDTKIIYVNGNLFSFVQRLSSQFLQSLSDLNEHDAAYVTRLADETTLVKIIAKSGNYYQSIKKEDFVVKVKLLQLSHTYYIPQEKYDVFKLQKEDSKGYLMKSKPLFSEEKSEVYQLCMYLYHAEGPRTKTIALLSHVYYYSIHNRFMEARNLLLMSHLQDVIHNADIHSRILYNRTLAQLGLCAFRNGYYGASLDCLSELYTYPNRIKELLAQGVTSTRYHERNLEKEKLERMREYPYHMHMNLDMLEAVNLISAMFAEVPNLAKHGKRKVISRSFRKQYDHHKKQAFTGPPESTRHLVMSASDSLACGDWEACFKYICSLRMWSLMPHADEVKENLKKQIQQSSLQVYLLVYGPQYCSIDMKQLCNMFGMSEKEVHKVASRMMLRNELLGAWDQPSACIIMHNEELSRLQQTALGYADKVAQYVEMNERLLDLRSSYYKTQDQRSKDQKGHDRGTRTYNKPKAYSRRGQMSRTSRY